MATRKLSVSIDEGSRGSLEGCRLGPYLDDLEEHFGPADEELVEEYRRQWPEL